MRGVLHLRVLSGVVLVMKTTLELEDFMNLMDAARFGIMMARNVKAGFTLDAWEKTIGKLEKMPLDDGRTQEQRDLAFAQQFAKDCELYGSD